MKIEIILAGQDSNEKTLRHLKAWIDKQIVDTDIKLEWPEIPPDNMGMDAGAILTVVMASPILIKLAEAINTWILARTPKLEISITESDHNRKVTINTENPDGIKDLDKILEWTKTK